MAVYLNNGVQVTVNSVDLSAYVSSVTLNRSVDELEITAMGDTGHQYVAGLEANSISIEFYNDFAATKVAATLDAAFGTKVTVVVQPVAGSISATNPKYTMSCLINNITPINGGVGDLATQSVTWNVSGAIVKTTA